jgi:hypothetical protein
MPIDIATLTSDDFKSRLQDDFRLAAPAGEIVLRLVEIRRLGHALRKGGAFALMFLSPTGPFLPQAIYPLAHPALGTLELFLVPLGPTPDGNAYEAVFT